MSKTLFEDFPPVSTDEWMSVVEKDLKGADFNKKLLWRSPEGLEVKPFYRQEDLESLEYLQKQQPGSFPYLRGKKSEDNRWTICQPITHANPSEANASAKKALAGGAEALSFKSLVCGGKLYGQKVVSSTYFSMLLEGIDATQVDLHFDWGQASPQALAYLLDWCESKGIDPKSVAGSITLDPLGQMAARGSSPLLDGDGWDRLSSWLKEARENFPAFRLLVFKTGTFHEAGSNLTQDLTYTLSRLVETVDALTQRDWKAEDLFPLMGVKAAVSTSYFMEIAFFRAMRLLWSNIAKAYGVEGDSAQPWIHGETAALNKTLYDPQVNILRQSTETMSAVIGGVDVMSVRPWNEQLGTVDESSERLARNTQLVIREESGLDHSVDPASGSYYLETLTDGLCSKAWKAFQDIEDVGGYSEALKQGQITEAVSASRAALDKGVATRRKTLLGTNQFPDGGEKKADLLDKGQGLDLTADQLAPCPEGLKAMAEKAGDGLPFSDYLGEGQEKLPALSGHKRLASPYEELRLQVESLDKTPTVYFWTFGKLAFRKARASFCQNFYACAGFQTIEGPGSEDVEENLKAIAESGAKWVVFCSSDPEYPEKVPALVQALKEKVPEGVPVVAGYPADDIDALKAAGVEDFVHLKTPAIDYLKSCVESLGGAS